MSYIDLRKSASYYGESQGKLRYGGYSPSNSYGIRRDSIRELRMRPVQMRRLTVETAQPMSATSVSSKITPTATKGNAKNAIRRAVFFDRSTVSSVLTRLISISMYSSSELSRAK